MASYQFINPLFKSITYHILSLPGNAFEGRAPKCCLLVFIDDAIGHLMHLRFGETESAFGMMS